MLYDNTNYLAIIKQLNDDFNVIHVNNRAQIIEDAVQFAMVGLLDFSTLFSLTTYLVKETNVTPFFSLMDFMTFTELLMTGDQEAHTKLRVNGLQ